MQNKTLIKFIEKSGFDTEKEKIQNHYNYISSLNLILFFVHQASTYFMFAKEQSYAKLLNFLPSSSNHSLSLFVLIDKKVSIRDRLHSRLCPFEILPFRDCALSRLYPFGCVSIRYCVHSGACPFGQLFEYRYN